MPEPTGDLERVRRAESEAYASEQACAVLYGPLRSDRSAEAVDAFLVCFAFSLSSL